MNLNSSKKIEILFFLHNSSGELFVGLPILYTLKKHFNVNIYFISKDKNILDTWKIDNVLRKKMQELGSFHFGKLASLSPLVKLLNNDNQKLIMSCYSGMRSIDKYYYIFLKNSSFVFYPHANVLLSIKNYDFTPFASYLNSRKEKFNKKFGKFSYLLSISELENRYFEQIGWETKKLFPIGALGYSEAWKKEILNTSKPTINIGNLKIFIPLREHKEPFFTKENYRYILDSLYTLFKKFPQHDFFVKFHPRQHNIQEIQKYLEEFKNVHITTDNPFEVAKKCDLTVSVWSSIVQDSIAVGTPAIEFYRHTNFFPQVIYDSGKLVSLYTKLGLVEFYDDLDELVDFIDSSSLETLQKLYDKQYSIFNTIFHATDYEQRLINAINTIVSESVHLEIEKNKEKTEMLIQILTKHFKSKKD